MTSKNLSSLSRVHVIGVGGTLMGAFAAYLKRRGLQVSGSDQNIYPPMSEVLKEAGVELFQGYRPENLEASGGKPDLVVIGNVITSVNSEARAAIDQGYSYSSLPEAMEKLFLQDTRNLVVAGTHGKTTTSSLLSYVLRGCQQDPSYFIGGVCLDLPFSFQISDITSGKLFVLEGDEYDTAFWDKVPKFNHYLPNDVLLTSIEYDHADIYPNLDAVVKAFEGLISRVRSGGRIVACFDYSIVKQLVAQSQVPVISYGSTAATRARFTPGNVRIHSQFTQFEVLDQGKAVDEVSLQIPGMHNVLNALSVWIECHELKLSPQAIRSALKSFRGVKRRQEERGEVGGVLVIDDFAHHPTAVRETLRALKAKYSSRRLITVFEPRSATSRRKIFQKQYAEAFQEAEVIFIARPFDQTKIALDDQFSSDILVKDLSRAGKQASVMSIGDPGIDEVIQCSRAGDLIAVLSNGGFDGFISKLLERL